MFCIVLHLLLLGLLEGSHALEHLVPVDKGTVEFRAVDADEFRLAANGQSAGTAHARTIHHDGVQRHLAGDAMLLSRQVGELHHDGRTDGKHLVHVLLLNELFDAHGDNTLLAVRAVVGHNNHFIAALSHLVFQDDKVLRTTSHNGEDSVASSLQRLYDGQHGSHAQTTSGTDYRTIILYPCGVTQRAYHVGHVVANL